MIGKINGIPFKGLNLHGLSLVQIKPGRPPRWHWQVITGLGSGLLPAGEHGSISRTGRLSSGLLGLALGLGWQLHLGAIAAPPVAHESPGAAPLFDIGQFQQGVCPTGLTGISDATTSASAPTLPSLWWIRDQVAAQPQFGTKLIEKWLACPTAGAAAAQVDVLVNSQLWTLLDYWERYEAVHRLGSVTTGYGYNLRIFNRQQVLLATYRCLPSTAATTPPATLPCTLSLDSASRGGFRGRSSSFDGGFPTKSDTGQP
jgi:hypothetical protein